MTAPLPVLLSIPHGGRAIPPALSGRLACSERDVFDDVDPCTREIYDLGPRALAVVAADVARTAVDVNRRPDDRPPANPDGVVKTLTCLGVPVYAEGREPDRRETDRLLARYHTPYHRRLEDACRDARLVLGLDCHSMRERPPAIAPDAGPDAATRPAFCLSTRHGATCPDTIVRALAGALAEAFGCPPSEVRLNDPFTGGYITQRHGAGRVPWIQVEMNRSWYLAPPWFDEDRLLVDGGRLAWLRERFGTALERMVERAPRRGAS